MTPFRSQHHCHCCLLLLLILLPIAPATAAAPASLLPLSTSSGSHNLVQQALVALVSGPLRGQDLLLVMDDYNKRLIDLDKVVAAAENSSTPILCIGQNSLLNTSLTAHQTKGTLLTALLLFYDDPNTFLYLLADNLNWNPNYLVLFCLDPYLNTTSVLSHPVVQRSQFILLLQLSARDGSPRLQAYTSLPERFTANGKSLLKAPLGVWTTNSFKDRESLFPPRYNDFGGQILKMPLMCYGEPHQYFDKNRQCIGFSIDVLNIIKEKLNFEVFVRLTDDYNDEIKDFWTWLLDEIMYGGNHLVINTYQITPERARDYDFTYPYIEDGYGFLLPVPPPLPLWRNVLYPFSTLFWGLLVVTAIIVSTSLAFIMYHLKYINDPINFILKVMGGLVNQPMPDHEVVVWWARIWLVVWWVMVDILAASYTGNLVAVLTVPAYPTMMQTSEELVNTDLTPLMIEYGSFIPEALLRSSNPNLVTVGERLYLDPLRVITDPYGYVINMTLAGGYVLIGHTDYLTFDLNRKGISRMAYLLDEKLFQSYLCWFLPKNTPYTSVFSRHVMRLRETGILEKIFDSHMESVLQKTEQIRGDGVLRLDHLQGAFIVLILGLVIGTATLFMERLLGTQHQKLSSSSESHTSVGF